MLTVGWADYGEFVVLAGKSGLDVTVTLDGIDTAEASLCFSISVLPMALPLVGLEALHGCALHTPEGALLVLGASGWGKSTLGSILAGRFPLLADDACALDADGYLWPGPPLVSVRSAALAAAFPGRAVGFYNDKHVLTPSSWAPDPVSVRAVVVLNRNDDASLGLRRATGAEALSAILGNVRSPGVLVEQRRALQLRCVTALCSTVPVSVLEFAPGRHTVAQTAEVLLTSLGVAVAS